MEVTVRRGGDRRYWSEVRRDDGVVLVLPGQDRKWRIPHDLAHLVTERELRLAHGLFGSIAAGAVFEGMRVVSGRPRHDARARSQQLLKTNARALTVAEVLAGVIHEAAEYERHNRLQSTAEEAWGVLNEERLPYGCALLPEFRSSFGLVEVKKRL